jgi:hypothetical protein
LLVLTAAVVAFASAPAQAVTITFGSLVSADGSGLSSSVGLNVKYEDLLRTSFLYVAKEGREEKLKREEASSKQFTLTISVVMACACRFARHKPRSPSGRNCRLTEC